MKISSLKENEFAVKNDERLNEQAEKFWKLDSMGILQDESQSTMITSKIKNL